MSLEDVVADPSLERPRYYALSFLQLEAIDDVESLFLRGDRLAIGAGVKRQVDEGWELIIEAAKCGHPIALALCFRRGKGTAVNTEKAVELYRDAVKRGHPTGTRARVARTHGVRAQ
jgi:TPR repeat protein